MFFKAYVILFKITNVKGVLIMKKFSKLIKSSISVALVTYGVSLVAMEMESDSRCRINAHQERQVVAVNQGMDVQSAGFGACYSIDLNPINLNQINSNLVDLNKQGMIYFAGRGVEKNYAIACEYFEQIEQQNTDQLLVIEAKYHLGLIYLKGGYGVEKNYAKARKYFEQVEKNQSIDQLRVVKAAWYLGYIYFEGGHGVEKNYAEARKYLEPVANQDNFPIDKAEAQKILNEINAEAGRNMQNVDTNSNNKKQKMSEDHDG